MHSWNYRTVTYVNGIVQEVAWNGAEDLGGVDLPEVHASSEIAPPLTPVVTVS